MKKVLMPVMALMVLFAIAPVLGRATKTPFTAQVTFISGSVSPGKMWTTKGNITHVKGSISSGNVTGGLTGTVLLVTDEALDLNTGMGVVHGKFVLTVAGGTFKGSSRGLVTGGTHFSGTFVAQGTGAVEGKKLMGSFEGEVIQAIPVKVTLMLEGMILSPKG